MLHITDILIISHTASKCNAKLCVEKITKQNPQISAVYVKNAEKLLQNGNKTITNYDKVRETVDILLYLGYIVKV